MLMRRTLSRAALFFAAAIASAPAVAESLSVHGSTTVDALVMTPLKEQIEREGNVSIAIRTSNSGRGLIDLSLGAADIAMISAPFADVAERLKQTAKRSLDPAQFAVHEIGHARILFIVNRTTPVASLTKGQLAAVLTGQATRWSDVGGGPISITVVTEQAAGAMRTEIVAKALEGRDITPTAAPVTRAVEAVDMVAAVPGAIGFVSSVIQDKLDKVKVVNTEVDLDQTLIIVTKAEPKPEVKRAVDAIVKISAPIFK